MHAADKTLLAVFDRIYIINLARRADRRAEMEAQLRRIGLSLDHPAVTLFPAVAPSDPGGFPSLGARGCFESHLGVHRRILNEGVTRALVLEDDADFVTDFVPRMAALAPRLAAGDWGMFCSVRPVPVHEGAVDLGDGLIQLAPRHGFSTSHFLGFDRRFSQIASDYLAAMAARPGGSPQGGPMHVDGAYAWLRAAQPDLRVWATRDPLSQQRPSRSDIAALRVYDRVPGLRALAGWARRLKH